MKTRLLTALALGTAIITGYAAPSSAAIVYVAVTGTVASGTDGSGLFGAAGTNLSGDAYIAQYKFDTSLGGTFSSAQLNYADGGSSLSSYGAAWATSPSLGASITINGQSVSIAGTYEGYLYGYNNGSISQSYALARDSSDELVTDIYGYPGTSTGSIATASTVYAADNYYHYGNFYDNYTNLNLSPAVYTISLTDPTQGVAAVPEPASMALLGVGLFGTGVAVRRRRQSGKLI